LKSKLKKKSGDGAGLQERPPSAPRQCLDGRAYTALDLPPVYQSWFLDPPLHWIRQNGLGHYVN